MGKVSAAAKTRYAEKLREFKDRIQEILEREKSIRNAMREEESRENYHRLALVEENLNLVSYYVLMNELSVALLGIKNEGYLNEARKTIYKAIILLEEVVSNLVDAPFSDYEAGLESIEEFGDQERLTLIRKLGFAIDTVEDALGENSKWRWSFVEIEGRFATVVKNLLDLRTFMEKMDPRHPSYSAILRHVDLTKRLLQQAADRYREKYELSTQRFDDMKIAISYLGALRRLHILVADAEEAGTIKKKMDVWKHKMEEDLKRSKDAAKSAARAVKSR